MKTPRPPIRYLLRSEAMKGEKNHNWKGDKAGKNMGHIRAIKKFPKQPCEVCSNDHSERHHIDGNTLNNSPENIKFLCRKHHMELDGRLKQICQRNASIKIPVDLTLFMKLYNDHLTEYEIAEKLRTSTKVVRNRRIELSLPYNGPYRNRKQYCGGRIK